MKYSIVVAVFDRPDELDELLHSLRAQTFTDFEVIVVDDGSTKKADAVCTQHASALNITYYWKTNSGPGLSRNYGCRRARGDWFIYLDSDCTVPPEYLHHVDTAVTTQHLDAFGGPDREHGTFTPIQKAISYSMTSILTTGGIRGSAVRTGGAFHPRSFNMGMTRDVFNATEGFSSMRFGEDIDLSLRIIAGGFTVGLITDAWVYHKRRATWKQFYRQVFNSGLARINLFIRHPRSLKVTHFFPAAFTAYLFIALVMSVTQPTGWYALLPLALYVCAILMHGAIRYRSLTLGVLCGVASVIQLVGYGLGFATGILTRIVLGRPEQGAFVETFYQ
jgi:glycosyltransferase involved in cell wall biosynthesis